MKHLFRIVLIFVLLIIMSLAGVVLAVRLYLPPAKIIQYIQDTSLGFIGRSIKIDTLSYGIHGIDIHGFSLSNPLNFSAGTLISLDLLHIGYVWHPLRPVVSGRAGSLTFEGIIHHTTGYESIILEDLQIRADDKLLVSSGTINNIHEMAKLSYSFSVHGDRTVLDRVFELFPALSAFQYGDSPTVHFVIEGSPQGVRLTRMDTIAGKQN